MLRNERLRTAAILLLFGGLVALLVLRSGPAAATAPSPPAGARTTSSTTASPPRRMLPPAAPTAGNDIAPEPPVLDQDTARRARMEQTLLSYLDWARYPPLSRPARERPDRLRPHASSPRTLPLRTSDGGRSRARVVQGQSHLYLAGDERAALTIACERDGAPVTCAVRSAVASSDLPGAAVAPAALTFADDGRAPDGAAGDGALAAAFAPGAQGFAGFTGPVRVTLDVDADGERGVATFLLVYTSDPPATFTGAVREQLTGGSLHLCLGVRVREAGRYLLDARVDDASGDTFAFVTFDGELAARDAEACFEIFGKLVHDEEAQPPFTLRDVEGFRLLEDTYPDRRTVPTWEGRVHTTATYALRDFADAEWESDAKAKKIAGLRARADLAADP